MIPEEKKYCVSITQPQRFVTRVVRIGDVPLGGNNPIRVQSMTTTDTMDTLGTALQAIELAEAGCEYVRITAPSVRDAQNLAEIKKEIKRRGYEIPLIADIHFTPHAAEIAARIVEKIRINPGNFADKKRFKTIEYTDKEYEEELERIREKFIPLIKVCKEYGTAMRIGTNHGSLSDRIMSRFGDTPEGMVESALEFVRICEEENYHDIVLSMKASNLKIMIEAYRLLVNRMMAEGMNYPLHLGVTEAGEGEDGRIKSAAGIGTLLEDGIGDTIRVSLTEPPVNEIPVAKMIAERYSVYRTEKEIPDVQTIPINPFNYEKRRTFEVGNFGGGNPPRVIYELGRHGESSLEKELEEAGYFFSAKESMWKPGDAGADYFYVREKSHAEEIPPDAGIVAELGTLEDSRALPLVNLSNYHDLSQQRTVLIQIKLEDLFSQEFSEIANKKNVVFVAFAEGAHPMIELRRLFFELKLKGIENPVIIRINYDSLDCEKLQLYASTDFGGLLADGFGDGIWITGNGNCRFNSLAFGILQATRARISRTEYIACPSCGRTLFDLVEVTAKIRKRTEHLKGIKIGIMGCIVNGPGEMADADYGYVGSGVGKITLYRGKEVVKRNVPSEKAVDELIDLIKSDGKWREKENS